MFIPVDGTVRRIGRVTPITVPPAELAVMWHYGSLDDIDLTLRYVDDVEKFEQARPSRLPTTS